MLQERLRRQILTIFHRFGIAFWTNLEQICINFSSDVVNSMSLDPTILKQRVPKTFDNGTTKKTKERTTHYPGPNDPTFWAGGIPEGIRI